MRGEREAFAQLVRKYQAPLVTSACHLIHHRDDAEDLAQETFVEAYRQLRTLREGEKFAAWLFAILRSKCLQYLRRRRHDVPLEAFRDTLAAPLPSDDGELIDALYRLPLRDREVLAARYLQELDFDEVAGALGIGIDAARMRCSRARERLRLLLREEDEERARLLMRRAMGIFIGGGLGDAFTSRVLKEVETMQATPMPHATAHSGVANSVWPHWIARLAGWKIAAGILGLLVIGGAGVMLAVLAGNSQQSSGINPNALKQAFRGVATIHLVGEGGLILSGGEVPPASSSSPTKLQDKWIRRDPFTLYEEMTPTKPSTKSIHSIYRADTKRSYRYLPERHQVTIADGMKPCFSTSDSPLAYESWLAPQRFKVVGQDEIDDKRVILLEINWSDEKIEREFNERVELAVDPETKLARRIREFAADKDGKPVVITNLRVEYNNTPPEGIFDWQPPANATIVDKRQNTRP